VKGRSGGSMNNASCADIHPHSQLDIVALNGAAFIARHNNPGGCPSDWQAIAL